jgi:methylated-DNA-[protein]-cysteine S-methyltransferase
MTIYTTMYGPLGELLLVGEEPATTPGGVTLASVSFSGQRRPTSIQSGWRHDPAAFEEIERQIRAYFAGELQDFDLEHATQGTDFQEKVWAALESIPYGTTTTYGKLTERIGAPRDRVRAVGAAIGANPLLVLRPCHRVVGADGSLTGYAGGLERKHFLLTHEGALQAQLA